MLTQKTPALVLVSSYLFALWLVSWITFYAIGNISLFFSNFGYLFLLSLGCICFVFSLLILRKLIVETKKELLIMNEKANTVQDYYQYQQFLNPPDSDSYN